MGLGNFYFLFIIERIFLNYEIYNSNLFRAYKIYWTIYFNYFGFVLAIFDIVLFEFYNLTNGFHFYLKIKIFLHNIRSFFIFKVIFWIIFLIRPFFWSFFMFRIFILIVFWLCFVLGFVGNQNLCFNLILFNS